MARTYLVTRDPDEEGRHAVHSSDCAELPEQERLSELGVFDDDRAALDAARGRVGSADGCRSCCAEDRG